VRNNNENMPATNKALTDKAKRNQKVENAKKSDEQTCRWKGVR